MAASSITLQSLLETHDQPFVIIDAGLRVVAVNRAYERCFGIERGQLLGQACCHVTGEAASDGRCRHQRLFQDFEPYRLTYCREDGAEGQLCYQVSGYPLLDASSVIFLGESILPLASQHTAGGTRMVGRSPAFRALSAQLERAATTNVPVLLQGETGTGKEVAADFVHQCSARRDRQLVVVDCTVLGEDLFESELFGHAKGAFTGAAGTRKGLFEMADQGTLFLDEIGELPLSQQPKLLRALESGTYRRVGESENRRADVRVVAATNRNLADRVRRGEFREDLFYRLAVFSVKVPPLRERREDLPHLCNFLLGQIGACLGRRFSLDPDAIRRLASHAFPGNIRELRNILQLAATLATGERIGAEQIVIPEHLDLSRAAALEAKQMPPLDSAGLESGGLNPMEDMEKAYIAKLLHKHAGSRKHVAAEMNVSERTLYRKLKRYEL
jgi:transcriptional regulator with PAS, ATPase and Fis domain